MKTKIATTLLLALLMAAGMIACRSKAPEVADGCGSCAGEVANAAETGSVNTELPPDSTGTIVVYYFHATQRCSNCYKIETYTHEAVESEFASALQSGRVVWKMINTDEAENEHYIKDYKLFTKSVIISDFRDGQEARWKNLDKVWTLLGDKNAFQKYIRDEVHAYLGA